MTRIPIDDVFVYGLLSLGCFVEEFNEEKKQKVLTNLMKKKKKINTSTIQGTECFFKIINTEFRLIFNHSYTG